MMFTPWGPRAVPTGGAGVAAPAGIWILTTAATRLLAIRALLLGGPGGAPRTPPTLDGTIQVTRRRLRPRLQLCYLAELELDRSLPAEDVDQHLELHLVVVDLGDRAGEVGERPFPYPDALADLEHGPVAGLLRRALGAGRLHLQ